MLMMARVFFSLLYFKAM